MKYGDYKKRQINDIVVKGHMDGFDVRQSNVRHQSIGYLDDEYLGTRHLARGARSFGITYVPPLKNLYLHKDKYSRRARLAFSTLRNGFDMTRVAAAGAIGAMGASLASTTTPLTARLPKRYTARRGLRTDYSAPVFAYLKLMVLAVVLLIGTVILFPGKESQQTPLTVNGGENNKAQTTGKSSSGQSSSSNNQQSNTQGNSSAAGSGSGGGSQAAGSSGASPTRSSGSVAPSGTSAAPATGGSGGGSAPAPTSGSTTPTGGSGGSGGGILPGLPTPPLTVCTKEPLPTTCIN